VELIVGKTIPTLVIGLLDGLLMIGVIILWFQIPVRGSVPLLVLLSIPFILAQVGWGTLISLISRNQQQAVLFVFALAMLEIACSGIVVPASDMPQGMRVISQLSSVQHFLVILRGVLLRGASLGSVWVPAVALIGIALSASTLAWLRLRMGLDADSLRQQLRDVWRQRQEKRRDKKDGPSSKPSNPRHNLTPQPVLCPIPEQATPRRRRRS
jgi:ABC-2 type transport system permease protein